MARSFTKQIVSDRFNDRKKSLREHVLFGMECETGRERANEWELAGRNEPYARDRTEHFEQVRFAKRQALL
jgi:hypothetical protein